MQMIGKLLGHKVAATTQRYAHLARDAAAAVNDELGAAMQAAIEEAAREGGQAAGAARSSNLYDDDNEIFGGEELSPTVTEQT